jgi:hypothetical protein
MNVAYISGSYTSGGSGSGVVPSHSIARPPYWYEVNKYKCEVGFSSKFKPRFMKISYLVQT